MRAEPIFRGGLPRRALVEPCGSGAGRAVRIELTAGAPELGPAAARALLRIIQDAHTDSGQDGLGSSTELGPGAGGTA
jgi:hypothetical protein